VERVLNGRPETTPVQSGEIKLEAEAGETAMFEVPIELEPGDYNLRVFHGDGDNQDSKRFTVY